jgi:hypothetical protein
LSVNRQPIRTLPVSISNNMTLINNYKNLIPKALKKRHRIGSGTIAPESDSKFRIKGI